MKTNYFAYGGRPVYRKVAIALAFLLIVLMAVQPEEARADTDDSSSATMMLEAMGVISPDSSGNYNLGANVTRAQYAKMLVMASKYKDQVAASSYSSLFRDVSAGNWAAPYIKLAASNNLLSGYSNGTFNPDSMVTLEQGVNSALLLLGYTSSDFTGAFPYAQMNLYSSLGLSSGIVGGIGTLMTKGDAVQLIYNALKTDLKDGSKSYAESLGYSVNDNGEVDYAGVVTDNMNGPYTVTASDWYTKLGINSGAAVYKNGNKISLADVENYDIVYYSNSKSTVWAYNDRVTGIYDKAEPSQDAVTSITLSGKTYTLESTKAFSALSSTGNLKIGDAITLLLGRTGNVADAVSSTVLKQETILYVTTADKTAIEGVTPTGSKVAYTVDKNTTVEPGDVIKITFDSGGNMQISSVSGGGMISGTVDSDLMNIGNTRIAGTATILDTYEGAYTATSISRLDGLTLDSDDVLYYEARNGSVTSLILNNVTGDSLQYGVITSAKSSGKNSSGTSGSYIYDIKGTSYSLNSSDTNFNVSAGPAMFYGDGDSIEKMKNITRASSKVQSFDGSSVTFADGTSFKLAADVAVYEYKTSTGTYSYEGSVSDALEAYKSGKMMTYCYDKGTVKGGQIRVIIYQ
ncbi:S-layer homology domain-containing protein [Aminipila luticellarii]|uniref:S-layer homology domain-containing protein n=1 Tax=Aminipila luticellarii TaxID=2507160 RepID=A0A410PS59_9FIRM|nr:S-layer homology domain-containing protein [Aminipila luticellarii]QAT41827.1 S-layer homology domain-containing protein [Aminipila luticellarii]